MRLQEFSEDRAAAFLKRHGKKETLPDWLPRKPLILGYLAHQDLLDKILRIDASRGFGFAWDSFITLVCNREAQLERAVMEPRTIRRVLERLSCVVRATSSGTGPISGLDLAEAYRAEAGEGAGEGVLAQLQRLPGLTPREQDPAARSFVDQDLLAALQGSAVVRAVVENSGDLVEGRWLTPLTRDGIRMAAYLLESNGFDPATVLATARRLGGGARCRVEKSQLVADCLAVAIELSDDDGDVDAGGVSIPEAVFDVVDLEQRRLHGVTLSDCTIETLVVGEGLYASRLRVENSIVGAVSGVQSATALPKGMFVECAFGAFDDASTNAAVLRLDIVPPVKALMTVLRKLYLQAGGGRSYRR